MKFRIIINQNKEFISEYTFYFQFVIIKAGLFSVINRKKVMNESLVFSDSIVLYSNKCIILNIF